MERHRLVGPGGRVERRGFQRGAFRDESLRRWVFHPCHQLRGRPPGQRGGQMGWRHLDQLGGRGAGGYLLVGPVADRLRHQSLPWRSFHLRHQRDFHCPAGQPDSPVGWHHVVRPRWRAEQHGQRLSRVGDQPLCGGMVSVRHQFGSHLRTRQLHREMGWCGLVRPGERDEQRGLCPGAGRGREQTVRGR